MKNNHLDRIVGAESPHHAEVPAAAAESHVTPQPQDEGASSSGAIFTTSTGQLVVESAPHVEAQSNNAALPSVPPFKWGSEETFDYKYSDGKTYHQVGYRDTPEGRQIFERGIPLRAKKREWTDDMSRVMRVPYDVQEVNRRKVLIFVESEAAADLLNQKLRGGKKAQYAAATTTAGGLGRAHHTNIANYTNRKVVIVLPTNDEEGLRHANEVCRLVPRAALRKIVELPHRSPGGGVEDFFAARRKIRELIDLIVAAPNWTP